MNLIGATNCNEQQPATAMKQIPRSSTVQECPGLANDQKQFDNFPICNGLSEEHMRSIYMKLAGFFRQSMDGKGRPDSAKRSPSARRFSPATSVAIAALGGLAALSASTTAAFGKCNEYELPSAFSVRQSNGFDVAVTIAADRSGDVTGSANYGYPKTVGQILKGSFDGRVLNFRVNWSGGLTGTYEGSINQSGKLVGVTRGGGGIARFESVQKFACSS